MKNNDWGDDAPMVEPLENMIDAPPYWRIIVEYGLLLLGALILLELLEAVGF